MTGGGDLPIATRTFRGNLPTGLLLAGYRPGAIGAVGGLHGRYYAEHWGLGLYFEAKVASDLSAFLLRLDKGRDGLWTLWQGERFVGSIAIDGSAPEGDQAHLRWLILDPQWHGQGLGRYLLDGALNFCRQAGFGSVYLWTFAGLDDARRLYEGSGFDLEEELDNAQWGQILREQRFRLRF